MTAQIPDLMIIDGSKYALTAIEGDGPLRPADLGLTPRPTSTGCYRGFVATYAAIRDLLVLAELEVGHDGRPRPIDGVTPKVVRDNFVWVYHNIAEPMDFTGRLLVGRHTVANPPYLNMGFWPAWFYRTVYELHFEEGRQIERIDRSAELGEVGERIGAVGARPAPGESTSDWVSRTFSLTFEYSWPTP